MVISFTPLGGFFGALVAGPLSDTFGRKPIIQVSDVVFVIGTAIMVTS
jgi:MFS family permease